MQIHRKLNILISKQLITEFNPLYDLAYTPRDLQPYYTHELKYTQTVLFYTAESTHNGVSQNIHIIINDM